MTVNRILLVLLTIAVILLLVLVLNSPRQWPVRVPETKPKRTLQAPGTEYRQKAPDGPAGPTLPGQNWFWLYGLGRYGLWG